MYLLARAEGNHLPRSHFHSVPGQYGLILGGQRNKKRVRGHRDKIDPREVLVAGRQVYLVQRNSRQPRPKLAALGDQHVEEAVRAQPCLVFVRLAENRHDAARHFD